MKKRKRVEVDGDDVTCEREQPARKKARADVDADDERARANPFQQGKKHVEKTGDEAKTHGQPLQQKVSIQQQNAEQQSHQQKLSQTILQMMTASAQPLEKTPSGDAEFQGSRPSLSSAVAAAATTKTIASAEAAAYTSEDKNKTNNDFPREAVLCDSRDASAVAGVRLFDIPFATIDFSGPSSSSLSTSSSSTSSSKSDIPCVAVLKGHEDDVYSVTFHPTGVR